MRHLPILAIVFCLIAPPTSTQEVLVKPFKSVTGVDAQNALQLAGIMNYQCFLSNTSLSGNLPMTAVHTFPCEQWHQDEFGSTPVYTVMFENGYDPKIITLDVERRTTRWRVPT